ncbi:MAG: AMP-binding protein, partial [Ignavibacteria bacterium]|nr:AMP-binding protein [Ignavibacteria bacterium]
MNEIIRIIKSNFSNYSSSIVLKFDSKEYTYQELKLRIATIVNLLNGNQFEGQNIIGFDASETSCFETYSQIFACFFAGKCFVPINFSYPKERIEFIVNTTQIKTILINDSSNFETFKSFNVNLTFINTNSLLNLDDFEIISKDIDENALAYILFTSGSTGIPKGVPLTRKNLLGFAYNFLKLNYHITPADRFLQMFDFTFDLSIFSYFIPLLYGASIHPISSKGIKLSNTFNTMMDNKVTIALVVPSLLSFLKPYYEEIELPHLRYLFFCGEALSNELTFQFSKCIPNARIVNFYGPT